MSLSSRIVQKLSLLLLALGVAHAPLVSYGSCLSALLSPLRAQWRIASDVVPKSDPPVMIGILMEAPSKVPGTPPERLLALEHEIGNGHAGLLKTLADGPHSDMKKILWAGEVLLERTPEGAKIAAANETAGILVGNLESFGIGNVYDRTEASAQHLAEYLSKNASLRAPGFKALSYDPKNLHFNKNAPFYSHFRHENKLLPTDVAAYGGQIAKLKLRALDHALSKTERIRAMKDMKTYLHMLSDEINTCKCMIGDIEKATGRALAGARDLEPWMAKVIARQPLTKEHYRWMAEEIEKIFSNYQPPRAIFLPRGVRR